MDPDSFLCRFAELFDGVTVTAPSMGAIVAISLAVLLLFASGFVSASEIAFFSLSPGDLNEVEEEEHSSDKYIKDLLADSERLLATILISNNFVNVMIIMLCNFFFAEVIDFGTFRRNHAEDLFRPTYLEVLSFLGTGPFCIEKGVFTIVGLVGKIIGYRQQMCIQKEL